MRLLSEFGLEGAVKCSKSSVLDGVVPSGLSVTKSGEEVTGCCTENLMNHFHISAWSGVSLNAFLRL